MAEALSRFAVRHPLVALAIISLLTVVGSLGLPHLRSVSFLEGNLPRGDRALSDYTMMVDEFGSDQSVVLGISCIEGACQEVFDPRALMLVRRLSDRAAIVEGIETVESLSTTRVLVAAESDLALIGFEGVESPEALASFRSAVTRDPLLQEQLISKDLRTTAIVATFRSGLSDADRNSASIAMVDDLRNLAEAEGFKLFASGTVLRAAVADGYVRRDLLVLTPMLLALVALLLFWILRDYTSVATALTTVGIPSVWAFGLMGWTGTAITPVVSTMPIVILVIGITDAVHFLVRVHELSELHPNSGQLVEVVAQEVGPPTTVTAITSALGFLSFLAGPIPSLREFGVLTAVGILGCWAMTFSLIPIIVSRRASGPATETRSAFRIGDGLLVGARTVGHKHALPVLGATAVLLMGAVVGVTRIVPENDTTKLLGEGDPLVVSEQFFRDYLRPADTLEVMYAPDSGDLLEPEQLERLEAVENVLHQEVMLRPILSVLTILRQLNREIGDGTLTVPRGPNAASQLLLLAEGADPGTSRSVLTADYGLARISAGYAWKGSQDVEIDLEQVREALADILGAHGKVWLTGSVALSTHLGDVVLRNQVSSFLAAITTIFAVVLLFVKNLPLAILGMVPNVLPVAMILGFMGLVEINLDVGTAMIASIVLGVSTDDTVYFLLHYKRARAKGATVKDSVAYTFAVAGKPAIFSAATLAVGFFVLGFSSFQSLAIFGLLSGVAVLLALICELLVLPAILELSVGRREDELH